ncbi:acyl-CoA reductase [Salinispirillum marinum]|uniref:Acyl-CoA reductase n=2 Tax=Saccharospirillaceae TaxID=255527 RepID=A0ABV8BEE7_9GAMM
MQFEEEKIFEAAFDSSSFFKLSVTSAFSEDCILFLSQLSKSILKDKDARQFPDLMTFGYFCRKANLLKFKDGQLDKDIGDTQFGRGVCLHIAPANIPMNFAYSFIMGFMSGNKNIIRLPSKRFPQIDIFLRIFEFVTNTHAFNFVKERNSFIRSDRNSQKLIDLVSKVDALVVWGGDSTVKTFRALEKKVSCFEVYFPDRVSSFLINCDFLIDESADNILKLCENFYNDTYLVDQNACSSPSMILWYSKNDNHLLARTIFSNYLNKTLEKKYEMESISRIEKDIDVMRYCNLVDGSVELDKYSDVLWYMDSPGFKLLKPKLGVFISKNIADLELLPSFFRDNEQTLTYYGFDNKDILKVLLNKVPRLIDRIVPVGKALDIGFIWDGKNMINTLSKYMDCQ